MTGPADHDSFSAVYQAHFEYAWACLRRLGVPAEAQEDALQDLFLVVHRRLPAFAGRSSLKTWIFGVARKVAARYRRTEARRVRRHERLAAASPPEPAPVGEDELARGEARRLLADFLDELDDDRRAMFVLHVFEDLSGPEIATTLGLNLNTVYSRLRLIRAQLDRSLAERHDAALRAARAAERAPEGSQRRVWGALVVQLGGPAATAAPTLAQATTGLAGAPWIVGLAGAAAIVVLAVRPSPTPPAPPTVSSPSTPAPTLDPPPPPGEPPIVPAPAPKKPRRPIAAPVDSLAAETALMSRARAAVDGGRPHEALELLDQHAREHPDGALRRERAGFRAVALCQSGRTIEGRGEASSLLREHPGSALAARLRAACELTAPAP